jgi:hypothetical protein
MEAIDSVLWEKNPPYIFKVFYTISRTLFLLGHHGLWVKNTYLKVWKEHLKKPDK